MGTRGRGLPVELLRRGLLLSLLAFVAVVAALYILGRMGRPAQTRLGDEPQEQSQGELVLSGTGFDYGLTKEDREIFHIRAERIVSDRQDNYELEGVELSMKREDGSMFRLTSDRAVYDLRDEEATFRGNVHFFGPRNVELTTEGLELREEGELLVSSSPVAFEFLGRFVGSADRLRISPSQNLFVLAGDVAVDTLPGDIAPMSLRCRRFSFERDDRRMRADGQVSLHRGEDTLRARRLSVILSEDESRVEFIHARWNVSGEMKQLAEDGQSSTVEVEGRVLSVVFETGTEEPRTVELYAGSKEPARLAVVDESGLMRRIRAAYLVGHFESGNLREAEAFEDVEITELLEFDSDTVFRSACAEEATARLSAAGELSDLHLEGAVVLHQVDVQALGDVAYADLAVGEMELHGSPALLLRSEEQLEAPSIVYIESEGEIVAEKEVRAVLSGGERFDLSTNAASRGQPIRIDAERAEWRGDPSVVTFRGRVKAWQGENFLLSDELRGETETSVITASGRVKTVWRPEPEEAPTAQEAPSDDEALPREPLEITADDMEYRRSDGILVYRGNARAVQLKRTLRCDEIRLFLSDDDGFEEMVCDGGVNLQDQESGDNVTGQKAFYRPGSRTIRVEGNPVTLRDSKGTEIQGQVLVYDFDTHTARIRSEEPAPLPPEDGS